MIGKGKAGRHSAVDSKKGLHRKNKTASGRLSWEEKEPAGGEGGGRGCVLR